MNPAGIITNLLSIKFIYPEVNSMNKLIPVFILFFSLSNAQNDSLESKEQKKFENVNVVVHNNSQVLDTGIKVYSFLNKAKEEQDTLEIILRYNQIAERSAPREKIVYLDSVVLHSRPFGDYAATFNAYLDQAFIFLELYEFKKALNASLNAYALARDNNDASMQINALLFIGHINTLWNNGGVSLSIYSKIDSLKNLSPSQQDVNLDLMLQLNRSNAYLQNKMPDTALVYIKNAFDNHDELEATFFYDSYVWNAGKAYFQKEVYERGLDSIKKVASANPTAYQRAMAHYYNAKYQTVTGNKDTAIIHYLKIDTLVSKHKLVFPEMKDVYNSINEYYLEKGDRSTQFLYLNKLIKSLNIHTDISNYISNTTRELYEIPEIIFQKEAQIELLQKKENQTRNRAVVMAVVLIVIIILSLFYIFKQRSYKKRFQMLMSEKSNEEEKPQGESQNATISVEVIQELMQKLENFEKNNEFVESDISLNEIARRFHTNSTYLSKVVNLKKDKNFSNYINDLRIEHCIKKLKTNEKLRNYTIKAIAEEMGFNNPQSFSNAFYKYSGIYPSFFISQLNKKRKHWSF